MATLVEQMLVLLQQTQLPDTALLQAATTALKEHYKKPESIPALFEISISSPEKNIRQMASVEMRKLITNDAASPWTQVPDPLRNHIKEKLLQHVLVEPESIVRHALARVISSIAAIEMPQGQWNDLLPFVETACRSIESRHREIGAFILFSVLEVVVEGLQNQVEAFLQLYATLLQDPQSLDVRIVTVRGLGVLAGYIDLEDKAEIRRFQELIPNILLVIGQCVEAANEDGSRHVFDALSTFLILEAPLLSKHVPDLVNFLATISTRRDSDDEYRSMALNALIMTIKYKKNKIQSLGLGKPLLESLMPIITEPEGDDEDDETPSKLAVRAVDSLATSLPPAQVFPTLSQIVHQYFSNKADPNQRRAALLALGVVVEGCSEFMRPHMDELWPFVLSGFKDEDPSVRKAACTCLGCITEWLEDSCIEKHDILVPALLNLVHDPVTQEAACTALDGLLEHLGDGAIDGYIVDLMNHFSGLLDAAPLKVKAVVVGAIGSAAHASGPKFLPYFQGTIQRLVPFLHLPGEGEEEELRGIAMDACGTFAEAVGAEAFRPYFEDLMKNAYSCVTSSSSRLRECAFLFFGVMARLYGDGFAPYLASVVPAFLQSIAQDEIGEELPLDLPGLLNSDAGTSSDNAIQIPSERIIDIEGMDTGQLMKVNSAIAIEKEIAVDTLGDLFVATKGHFLTYIEPCTMAVVRSVGHYYEGIRKSAITTLIKFIVTFHEIGDPPQWTAGFNQTVPLVQNVQKLLQHVMPELLEVFDTEDDRSVASTLCQELAESIVKVGPGMAIPYLDTLCTHAARILEGKSLCQVDPDDDEEEPAGSPEELAELDGMLISSCMDLVSALATVLGPEFGQAFGTFLPLLSQYYGEKQSRNERTVTIGTLGEIMTNMKSGITPFTEPLFTLFIKSLHDDDPEVRSNSAFALGVLVENTDTDMSSQYLSILQALQPFFQVPAAAIRAELHGRDNAAGAVARLILKNMAALPLDRVLPVLFSALPLQADRLEYQPILRAIFHLFQSNPDYAMNYVDTLLPIFAHLLNPNSDVEIGEENKAHVINLLQAVEAKAPGKVSGAGLSAFLAQ